jgi:hypothetical protein
MDLLGKLQCFPTSYFNKKKKTAHLSFTLIHSSSSFLAFFPRIIAASAQSSPPPFSHEPNKVANTNSQILFKFLTKQQKQIIVHELIFSEKSL